MKNLLFIPFAFNNGYETSVNISSSDAMTIYLKNCVVSLISAKKANDSNTDIAFVTNLTEIPQPYRDFIEDAGVKIIHIDYDKFLFGATYKWSLAFYKLCALFHIANEYDYDNIAYIDSDVFVQDSLNNIWTECYSSIMMYDTCQGLNMPNYLRYIKEVNEFSCMSNMLNNSILGGVLPPRYGGELFAAKKENAKAFVNLCLKIHAEMIELKYETTNGDEFISNLAALLYPGKIKNAGGYMFRFWSGRGFYMVSTKYKNDPVVFLHVPDQKSDGMLRLYSYYYKHLTFPDRGKVWKYLHLNGQESNFSYYIRKIMWRIGLIY